MILRAELGFRQMSVPYIPPKRTGVDLSHVRVNPDGSRSADISALKERPEVRTRLDAIRRRVEKEKARYRDSSGSGGQ